MAGVLIFQGMTVGVLPGDLTISVGDDGALESKLVLSTAYNVIPIWLRIAKDSLQHAKTASENLAAQWTDDAEKQKSLLIAELAPSMQVFVACGIALDALYDTLRPHANLSGDEVTAWRRNRTGRGKQIAAVIQRVYRLDNQHSKEFKKGITQITKFRDVAVHPSLELKNSCTRSDLEVGVDWKFSAYRYSNALIAFESTGKMMVHLYEKRSAGEKVVEAMENIFKAMLELGVAQKIAPEGAKPL